MESRTPSRFRGPRGVRLAMIFLLLGFGGGCATDNYSREVYELTKQYDRGELPREDYMRFVHDAEFWERLER